ncbi:MAG: hypothetical protein QX191_02050, partial [Methylococcaceae bacterium]
MEGCEQGKRPLFNAELARFNFGNIKNVINDGQQVFACVGDMGKVSPGYASPSVTKAYLSQANDSIKRCSDFMAHVSQKLRFGTISGVSEFLCVFPLADVGTHRNVSLRLSIIAHDGRD